MKHDVEKLPQWAQREIARLKRDVGDLQEKLNVGPEGSDTFARRFSTYPTNEGQPLGKGTMITFVWGERHQERIDAHLEGDRLIVRGGSSIAISPRAGNSVEIEVTR